MRTKIGASAVGRRLSFTVKENIDLVGTPTPTQPTDPR
jgi:hypothetical protein